VKIKTLAYALALVAPFWALVGVGAAYAATPPPWPDSAVGKHEPVRPINRPYTLLHVRLKGHPGLWTCKTWVPKHPGYMRCTPEKVK
jgi:hypothetical protein